MKYDTTAKGESAFQSASLSRVVKLRNVVE